MFSRREKRALAVCIAAAVVLACAWGAVLLVNGISERRSEQEYRELQEERLDGAARTVHLGETVELTAESTRTLVLWEEGTKRFTVNRVACYPTLAEAEAAEKLGNVFRAVPATGVGPDRRWQFLAVEVTIENVNVPCPEDEDLDAAWTLIDGEVAPATGFSEYQLASFSGSPLGASSQRVNKYHLPPGEQATYIVGFWVNANLAPEDVVIGIGNPYTAYGAPIRVSAR